MCVCVQNLRNGKAGNGEAGNDVWFEELKIVVRAPLEYGEYVLSSEYGFSLPWPVLELAEGVVGEERLLEACLQLLEGAPARRRRHPVHLRLHGYLHRVIGGGGGRWFHWVVVVVGWDGGVRLKYYWVVCWGVQSPRVNSNSKKQILLPIFITSSLAYNTCIQPSVYI